MHVRISAALAQTQKRTFSKLATYLGRLGSLSAADQV